MFCFGKTLLKFICWACSRKTLLCFGIHLTIVISHLYHKYPTVIVMQIIVRLKMTSTHIGIGRPICHCRRHVGAAVTAAMAAALSPPLPPSPLQLPLSWLPPSPPPPAPFLLLLLPLFGWLLSALVALPLLRPPLPAFTVAAVGCGHHCHWHHGHKLLPPAPSAATVQCSKFYNFKRYLINYPYLSDYGQTIFCLSFPSRDRATAPGQCE